MTKARIREIRQASAANSAHAAIIAELLTEVEQFQRRTRRGIDLAENPFDGCTCSTGPVGATQCKMHNPELPLAAKANPAKKARGTREEIIAYATDLGLIERDALWFFEKMTENEWRVGKQPVKDWRGRMRTWKLGEFFPSQKTNGQKPTAPQGPARCIL